MLWPVDQGEEVPVGWNFSCFLQDRRGILFQGGGCFFSAKGGECSDMWRDQHWHSARALGVFFFFFFFF